MIKANQDNGAGIATRVKRRLDWTNVLFISAAHLLAIFAVVYLAMIHFSWWTLGLAVLWFALCGLAITGGYHRLFAHPTYKARGPLRVLYLFFGAASVQNSALKWCADHRLHHARTDTEEDPYNITRGFWWAHIGWIFFKKDEKREPSKVRDISTVRDLEADPFVRLQDKHYLLLALTGGVLLPVALGLSWGDPLGALLVAGFLRLVLQWHLTFSVNSFAHMLGTRRFGDTSSARDSFVTALITLGEGYHNFHHRFPMDYRNGFRWFHLDPTKWFIWGVSKVGLTRDLRRTSRATIRKASGADDRERAGSAA